MRTTFISLITLILISATHADTTLKTTKVKPLPNNSHLTTPNQTNRIDTSTNTYLSDQINQVINQDSSLLQLTEQPLSNTSTYRYTDINSGVIIPLRLIEKPVKNTHNPITSNTQYQKNEQIKSQPLFTCNEIHLWSNYLKNNPHALTPLDMQKFNQAYNEC